MSRALSRVDDRLHVHLGGGSGWGRAAAEESTIAPDFPAPQVGSDGIDRCLIHGCTASFVTVATSVTLADCRGRRGIVGCRVCEGRKQSPCQGGEVHNLSEPVGSIAWACHVFWRDWWAKKCLRRSFEALERVAPNSQGVRPSLTWQLSYRADWNICQLSLDTESAMASPGWCPQCLGCMPPQRRDDLS